MDVVGIPLKFECCEEVGDENWITGIEGVSFYLLLDLLNQPEKIARHCFGVASGAIRTVIITLVNRSAIVPSYGLKSRQCLFNCLSKGL